MTVDLWINRIDVSEPQLGIEGGTFGGPALAYKRLVDLIESGEIEGSYSPGGGADARVSGKVLRQIVAGLGKRKLHESRTGFSGDEGIEAAIAEDGLYSVSINEF